MKCCRLQFSFISDEKINYRYCHSENNLPGVLAKKMLCLSTHISTILTEFPVSSCIHVADKLLAYGKIEVKVLKSYSSSLKEECCKSITLLFLEKLLYSHSFVFEKN